MRRAKFSGIRRNVAIAMGNSGDPAFIPVLEKLAKSSDPDSAEAAEWALNKLGRRATIL